ncbi:lysosomal protective protein-like [Oppia nitens]|uniref:lysosomal protective protein-like n=1 Tax=Oppia nitens TaxID=1686743 RepID=UPI0023DC1EC7|nr:lysosomal protective protein-like [Oppia nitens]
MQILVKLVSILFICYNVLAFQGSDDEITDLPGIPKGVTFKQYSGYLNASKGRHLFYWLVESQTDPANAPVVLWLNGGPGCSSMFGMLTENGPFRVNSDGKTLEIHNHSWNSVANIIYLEAPVSVGFSYDENTNKPKNTDNSTAVDNYLALESFFLKFPHLKKNPFYITGESYAGIYIPMLAKEIFTRKSTINLKGVGIGNGLLLETQSKRQRSQSDYYFELGHGLVTTYSYEALIENCCDCPAGQPQHVCTLSHAPNKTKCASTHVESVGYGPNPYNIYDVCAPDINMQQVFNKYYRNAYTKTKSMPVNFNIGANKADCPKDGHYEFMNTDAVRKALHVRENSGTWRGCGGSYSDFGTPQDHNLLQLINEFKLERTVVYNGNWDTVCDFISDQQFVDGLGYKQIGTYKTWFREDGFVGGFVKHFEKSLSFVVVRGAGHMVPADQPEAALHMFKFIIGKGQL